MKIGDLDEPIAFGRRKDLLDIPFKKLSADVRTSFKQEIDLRPTLHRDKAVKIAFRILECFLQITRQELVSDPVYRSHNRKVIKLFIGALYHPKFLEYGHDYLYVIAKLTLDGFAGTEFLGRCNIDIRFPGPTEEVLGYRSHFSELDLDSEALVLWRGWKSSSRSNVTAYIPLQDIYLSYGEEFTERLFQALNQYFSARAAVRIPGLKALIQLLLEENNGSTLEVFRDPKYTTYFFRKLLITYLESGYRGGEGAAYSSLATEWRNAFVSFANSHLISSGLFAAPIGGVPKPYGGIVPGAGTNIAVNKKGQLVKTKLLTDVPLHVSDERATEILFHEIENDIQSVRKWASYAVRSVWKRYCTRLELAPKGTVVPIRVNEGHYDGSPKRWLRSRENPEHVSNAAATMAHYGFMTRKEIVLDHMFPKGALRSAKELGLPVAGTFLPFCVLLVLNHPEITQAFLEQHCLYDENGSLVGVVENDAGQYLVGYKNRAGPRKAQQQVLLNNQTRELVDQIICLTAPLREYLRKKQDDNWRYLLLSSGKGFGYPKRWRQRSDIGSETLNKRIRNEFEAAGIQSKQTEKIMQRLALASVRASVGVQTYLQTQSVHSMARALGHREHDPRLLSHYLPEAIHAFFQERWIRIFQAGIIVEAMKDSAYLLPASGFNSMSEVHEFLSNNFFAITVKKEASAPPREKNTKVVLGVNEEILTLLIALTSCVRKAKAGVCGRAKYWSELGAHMIEFIESETCHNIDIKVQLASAKLKAQAVSFPKELVYE